jgi:hypothetical protein
MEGRVGRGEVDMYLSSTGGSRRRPPAPRRSKLPGLLPIRPRHHIPFAAPSRRLPQPPAAAPPHPARRLPQPPPTAAAVIFILLPSGRCLIVPGRRLVPRAAAASQRPRDWLGFQGDTGLGVCRCGGGGLDIFGLNNCGPLSDASGHASGRRVSASGKAVRPLIAGSPEHAAHPSLTYRLKCPVQKNNSVAL